MAEAFGLAAGVLQVAGFGAELGRALWTCARRLRHANKELQTLARQVDATAKCLGSVARLLDDPETKAFHTLKLYEDTRAVSDGCHEVFLELDKAICKFNDGGTKMSIIARLQWPLDSSKLTEPLKVLKNYNDVLHLMLAVLQIVEGRRAASSEELRALGTSLDRLTLSNEKLSESNKTLTGLLYSKKEQPRKVQLDANGSNLASASNIPSLDGLHASPFVTTLALPALPTATTSPPGEWEPPSPDPTHDHLQRCMASVQALAQSIASAMSAWQGQANLGDTDIHDSHARLVADLAKLPHDLECLQCSGRVPWSQFDLVRAATESLGTCTCTGRSSSTHWRPSADTATHPGYTFSDLVQPAHLPPPDSFEASFPSFINFGDIHGFDLEGLSFNDDETGAVDSMSPPEVNIQYAPPATHSPSFPGRARAPSLQPCSAESLSPLSEGRRSGVSRTSSPARGRNGSLSSRNRSTSNAVDARDYILDLANLERTPSTDPNNRRQQKPLPATFPCTLCPKRFTRAYNLRSHLRTHTDARPFACTVCGKAFVRQHDRKRHEALHSVEKKFICGGVLQSGESWGCGRRFARADALARHFWSEAGRVCLGPLFDEEDEGEVAVRGNNFPTALLQQYPALAALDKDSARQSELLRREAHDVQDFPIDVDEDYVVDFSDAEQKTDPTRDRSMFGGTREKLVSDGEDQIRDVVIGAEGVKDAGVKDAGDAIESKSAVQALLTRWLGEGGASSLLVEMVR